MPQPTKKNSVVAHVMDEMKQMIISGAYKPGDKLPTEHELSKKFKVGRSSIREALKVFHHLGVVESVVAKGTFLNERANISVEAITWALVLGQDDLCDVYELREAIEYLSFRRFASEWNENKEVVGPDLKKLKSIISKMYDVSEKNDYHEMGRTDFEFHECIIEAGGNLLFQDIYHTLQAFMTNEIMQSYERIGDIREISDDHAQILDALENKSFDEAILRHLEHFKRTQFLLGINKK